MSAPAPAVASALDAAVEALGVDVDATARRRLLAYVALLERWNRAFNLTGTRGRLALVERHVADCLSILPWVDRGPVLDVGSGAGLPGLVLAIARPDVTFTLLDAGGKKTRFLLQARTALDAGNVTVVRARVESWAAPERFERVVSRAALALAELVRVAEPLLAPAGRIVAMKGAAAAAEAAGLDATRWCAEPRALAVPGLDAPHYAVLVDRR